MNDNNVSLVTTYKNRRHHIEQTLETWIQKASCDYEIVIVDYESDDDISPLLSGLLSDTPIRHVRCSNRPIFNMSHARNIGANHAVSEWILYIDIDCKLVPGSVEKICEMIGSTDICYFGAVDSQVRKDIINGGLMLVRREDHISVCGFNENMQGWGFEDIDYRQRLESLGLSWRLFPPDIYECIDHDDIERVACYDIEKELSWMRNRQISLEIWKNPRSGLWDQIAVSEYRRET